MKLNVNSRNPFSFLLLHFGACFPVLDLSPHALQALLNNIMPATLTSNSIVRNFNKKWNKTSGADVRVMTGRDKIELRGSEKGSGADEGFLMWFRVGSGGKNLHGCEHCRIDEKVQQIELSLTSINPCKCFRVTCLQKPPRKGEETWQGNAQQMLTNSS